MIKCKRCGKILPDDAIKCDSCDYNIIQGKKIEEVFKTEEDPEVDENHRSSLVDNPILTFIFGLTSTLTAILIIANILASIISIGLAIFAMIFSTKPYKVKYKVFVNVGKWFGYIGFSLSIFFIVFILSQFFVK